MADWDIIIIGAGVAGLTAAATAARLGATVMVLDRLGAGGQIATVDAISNFPGYADPVAGIEVAPAMQEQAEGLGAEFQLTEVSAVMPTGDGFELTCDNGPLTCRALIIAAGSSRTPLGLDNEEKLAGRGVSHCASCDGPLFRGERVVVAGGGDSAFDEAAVLADHVAHVTVVYPDAEPVAAQTAVTRLRALANVDERPGCVVAAISGQDTVNGVTLRNVTTGETEPHDAVGVFVYTGQIPNTGFLTGLVDLDGDGKVLADADLQTSQPGVFVAGDIRAKSGGLIATAIGDGAIAAASAFHFSKR